MIHARARLSANQIALIALFLSVLSAAGSVYQWWTSGNDEKIRAAMELSTKYLEEAVNSDVIRQQYQMGQASTKDIDMVRRQEAKLEYAAFLTNQGLVNWQYLSQRVTCDIVGLGDRGPNAARFSEAHPQACKGTRAAPDAASASSK